MSNPLHELHQQAQAEMIAYGEMPIVNTFGEPQAEYAAIRKSAGLLDLPQRGVLELTGNERLQFLNNLITVETWNNQTRHPLEPGKSAYSFLLNIRGRIVADMHVLELGNRTILEVDRWVAEPLREVFEAYHFAEKVKIENRSAELHEIALHGPAAVEILSRVATDAPSWLDVTPCRVLGHDVVAWRDDLTGTAGVHLLMPVESARQVWMHLITTFGEADKTGKRRLRAVGWGAFNATRIEAGIPMLGIDFEGAPIASAMPAKHQREQLQLEPDASGGAKQIPGMLPAETGLMDRAVSLTKCYIGQEIVARMHARQQVARKIVGIRMETDALPLAGTEIFDESSNHVGIVTSSTNSPVLSNLAICLGVVKKPLFEMGAKLRIGAEGAMQVGTVAPTPFIKLTG